jgi:hypothetical protein
LAFNELCGVIVTHRSPPCNAGAVST